MRGGRVKEGSWVKVGGRLEMSGINFWRCRSPEDSARSAADVCSVLCYRRIWKDGDGGVVGV